MYGGDELGLTRSFPDAVLVITQNLDTVQKFHEMLVKLADYLQLCSCFLS